MAGFFGLFDYNKPGPGIPENAPPKSPFIVFFEILQRKFWNFIKINFMFLIFDIPAILLGYLVMLFLFPNIFPDAFKSTEALTSDMLMKFILLMLIVCVPMITVGPAQAGFTYILRNYAREEHAFIWSDFKDAALTNFKQSMIIGTINFIVTFLMLLSIRAYLMIGAGSIPGMIGTAIMFTLFAVFAMMNIYIYPILVTFELPIKQIYKNALIFAVIKFLPNLGILLLSAFIVFLTFGMIIPFNQLLGVLFLLLITLSLVGFITNFYAYPKLKKYMISRIEDEDDEDDEDNDEDEEEKDDENSGAPDALDNAGKSGEAAGNGAENGKEDRAVTGNAAGDVGRNEKYTDTSEDTSGDTAESGLDEPFEPSKDEHVGEDGVRRYF